MQFTVIMPFSLLFIENLKVYFVKNTIDPLPTAKDILYATDAIVWTHQSRHWTYRCSSARDQVSRNPKLCTRYVIKLPARQKIRCIMVALSSIYENEVVIAEAPLQMCSPFDSLLLYHDEGIRVEVNRVTEIQNESYGHQVECTLIPNDAIFAQYHYEISPIQEE